MRIVINHLTRMQPGFFCAAGLELKSNLHIRPILACGLTTDLLVREGGPFDLGVTFDLGPTKFIGHVPEIEDRLFESENLQVIEAANLERMRDESAAIARASVREIFGSCLQRIGSTMSIAEQHGMHSLGCCWVQDATLVCTQVQDSQRLRLRWREQGEEMVVAVSDIRLYEPDHRTVKVELFQYVQRWLQENPRVLHSLGLSRPYHKSEDQVPMHWLQVNNIHYR